MKKSVRKFAPVKSTGQRNCPTGVLIFFLLSAVTYGCTLKSAPIPDGVVPEYRQLTFEELNYGHQLFQKLGKDYKIDRSHTRYAQLLATFDNLVRAAGADREQWHLYLFNQSEIVEIRAVHGNYIFVWSGFLDIAENEDEIAALLACEIAHILAGHTKPVEFTILSELLFGTAEVATSVGLMFLSQGIVSVGGQGWMKHAYVEAADLDPLDREYSEEEEREALAIAYLLLDCSNYAPQAMLSFWYRVQEGTTVKDRKILLDRSVPIKNRIALLEEMLPIDEPAQGEVAAADDPVSNVNSFSK